jgi:hypothetical protein
MRSVRQLASLVAENNMMRRILYTFLIVIVALIIGYAATWAWRTAQSPRLELIPPQQASPKQQTTKYQGKFKRVMVSHGKISGGGSTVGWAYESSDGIRVWSFSGDHGSPSRAAKELQRRLKSVKQIFERTPKLDDKGKQIGERVIARLTIAPDTTEMASVLETSGSSFSWVYAISLEDVLEIERNPPP